MKEWHYLESEPYRARYAIAAWFLRDCDTIIEIGGYKTPISDFANRKQCVVVIDPRLERTVKHPNSDFGGYWHVAKRWQDWEGPMPIPGCYGAAMLGVEFDQDPRDCPSLLEMLAGAQRVVLEYVTDYAVAAEHVQQIMDALKRPVIADITLTIDGKVDPKDGWPPRGNRRMLVLE